MADRAPRHAPAADDACCPGTDCELLPRAQAQELAGVFKALADPTRVRLLQYLAESESGTACACHLPGALGITQPTLSFHMRKLHDAGLVAREKRGRWVHYTVRREALELVGGFLALPAQASGTPSDSMSAVTRPLISSRMGRTDSRP